MIVRYAWLYIQSQSHHSLAILSQQLWFIFICNPWVWAAAEGKAGVAEGYTYNLHLQLTSFMPLLLSTDLRQMWLAYICYLVPRGAHNNFNIQGNIIGFKTLLYNARLTARKCRRAVHHFNVMEATDKTNIAPPWAGGRRHPRVK